MTFLFVVASNKSVAAYICTEVFLYLIFKEIRMKKIVLAFCIVPFILAACSKSGTVAVATATATETSAVQAAPVETAKALPAPTDTTKPDADKTPYAASVSSINKDNLHEYLGRDDVVYIDLRDFGDYQGKHLRNFECIPFFAYIYNKEAGPGTDKVQLFGGETANPVSTYEESAELLKVLIPQDKTVFLMCQSGGRVAMCMDILAANGYDMSKIYNVGGMGQFTSKDLAPYVVDLAEFKINAEYSIEGLTRQ